MVAKHGISHRAITNPGDAPRSDALRAVREIAADPDLGKSKICSTFLSRPREVMVRSVQEALALREAGIGQICMGEVGGKPPAGFDFGNSPFEISGVDFGGKTIVQRTSAGIQGIVAVGNRAARLYAASLVTEEATVRALMSGSPDQISLVAMGDNGIKRTDEDELCAIHLRNRLEG